MHHFHVLHGDCVNCGHDINSKFYRKVSNQFYILFHSANNKIHSLNGFMDLCILSVQKIEVVAIMMINGF